MADDKGANDGVLKEKVKDRLHPPPSPTSTVRSKALEALVALLASDVETVRLQAAQAILEHTKEPERAAPAAKLAKKLTGGVLGK